MTHKKQAFQQIEETIKWNEVRGNTPDTLNYKLEIAMLKEELEEFVEAVIANDKVAMFDALLDLDFVRIGTLGKMGISADMQVDGYEAVLTANCTKSIEKSAEGKITKPKDFVHPTQQLQKILDERG